jgi:hypothetical protein
VIDDGERERIDADALARVDAAVEFAEASPFPAPESLYDDVYVLDPNVRGWYSAPHEEQEAPAAADSDAEHAANDEIPQRLTHALAAGEDDREATGGSG